MAGAWDKIKQKLEKGANGAQPSDWEAMHKKIDAQPALNRRVGIGFRGYLGALLLTLIGLGTFWYFYTPENSSEELRPAVNEQNKIVDQNFSGSHIEEQGGAPINNEAPASSRNKAGKETTTIVNPEKTTQNSDKPFSSARDDKSQGKDKIQPRQNSNSSQNNKRQSLSDIGDKQISSEATDEQDISVGSPEESGRDKLMPIAVQPYPPAPVFSLNLPPAGNLKPLARQSEKDDLEPGPVSTVEDDVAAYEEPGSELPAEEDIYNPYTGFKLNSISVAGKFLSDFQSAGLRGWQTGAEVSFMRGNWMFNTGLYYGTNQWEENRVNEKILSTVDSSYVQEITTRVEDQVRAIWVVDSFFAGHYEIDTIQVTITDTNQVLNIDTTRITTENIEVQQFRSTYVEMPITTGYRIPMKRFALDISGGVLINQVVRQSNSEGGVQSDFGMNLLLQPALHYRFNKNYSLFVRSGLRYNMLPNAAVNSSLWNYDFQVGIALGW